MCQQYPVNCITSATLGCSRSYWCSCAISRHQASDPVSAPVTYQYYWNEMFFPRLVFFFHSLCTMVSIHTTCCSLWQKQDAHSSHFACQWKRLCEITWVWGTGLSSYLIQATGFSGTGSDNLKQMSWLYSLGYTKDSKTGKSTRVLQCDLQSCTAFQTSMYILLWWNRSSSSIPLVHEWQRRKGS